MRLKINADIIDSLSMKRLVSRYAFEESVRKEYEESFRQLLEENDIKESDVPQYPSWVKFANWKYDVFGYLCSRVAVIYQNTDNQTYYCLSICEDHPRDLFHAKEHDLLFDDDWK